MENLQNLDHSFKSISKVKGTKIIGQERKTFQAFYSQPKTMLMVSIETGIERANICRYIAELERKNRIYLIKKGICPITKHRAGFYTTNPELFPAIVVEHSNTVSHEAN